MMEAMVPMDLSRITFPIDPNPDGREFWEAIDRREFVLPHCSDCGPFWYPRNLCPNCGSRSIAWQQASGDGVVHTHCTLHGAAAGHLRAIAPVTVLLVELAEGPRMLGLLDAPVGSVGCGDTVAVEYRDAADARTVPVFVLHPK